MSDQASAVAQSGGGSTNKSDTKKIVTGAKSDKKDIKKKSKLQRHEPEPEPVSEPEDEEDEDEEEDDEEEEEEEDDESDDTDEVSFSTTDILANDPLYFVLSKIFMTEDNVNVATLLQQILEKLDKLSSSLKKKK